MILLKKENKKWEQLQGFVVGMNLLGCMMVKKLAIFTHDPCQNLES
jgi:hypothetical protein